MNPTAFCYMLKGFLEGKEGLNAKETTYIKKELNGVFEHVIDKQYPEDGGASQAIHDGTEPKGGLLNRPKGVHC